jgi:malonate decarboxylase delta subunit
METLQFEFSGGDTPPTDIAARLVGVVASGNLEVLVEQESLQGACRIEVKTPLTGFGKVWQAVLEDFFSRHPVADVRVSINDMGATPAVVSLRLDQAFEEFLGGRQ